MSCVGDCRRVARNLIIDIEAMLSVYFNCKYVSGNFLERGEDSGRLVVECPCEEGKVIAIVEAVCRGDRDG